MSYYTDFRGTFRVEPAFAPEHAQILENFFKHNHRSKEYPSPWCDLWISDDNKHIFPLSGRTQEAASWLRYIKKNYLDSWGYRLSGNVIWRGESTGDTGSLTIDENGNIVETFLWDYLEDIIMGIPHLVVPNPIKPLDWENDEEYREFEVHVKFNKPVTSEHARWVNDFADTIHYARKRVDKSKYGRDGELFLDPVDMDNSTYDGGVKYEFMTFSPEELLDRTELVEHLRRVRIANREAELHRMRTIPAGDCPDMFCQWRIEDGRLAHDGRINFSRPVEWLQFLIRKFFEPNGYVLNGRIRWNGNNDFYDRGTIFIKDNRVSAFVVPYPEPTDENAMNRDGAY